MTNTVIKHNESLEQTLGLTLASPSLKLQPFVLNYWLIKLKTPLNHIHYEYVHPNGGMGLIFNLGEPLYFDNTLVLDECFMDGTHTTSSLLGITGDVFAIGIRFLPAGAFPFFSTPLQDINNLTIKLEELKTRNSEPVIEQLRLANSMNEIVIILEQWLLSNYHTTLSTSAHVLETINQIQLTSGSTDLKNLVSQLGIGQRQLERLFKNQVGMTPKKMTRILQIERARKILRSTHNNALDQTSHLDQFYDQPHFIREFKAVIGRTPSVYLNRNFKH